MERRGEAVVCILSEGARGDVVAECLRRVLEHTPEGVPIVLCGDGDSVVGLAAAATREVGTAPSIGAALGVSAPADVVLVSAGCLVAAGWLEGLRAAVSSDAAVATATPLNAGAAGVAPGVAPDDAAATVRASSPRLRARRAAAGRHCAWVRRSALELAGPFDETFSERCLAAGLAHVAADDVLVSSPDLEIVDGERYPRWARSVSNARRSVTGLAVLVDARVLTGPLNGSQLHVLELIAALARTGQAKVSALLPEAVSDHARAVLARLPEVDTDLTAARADIAHRPFQVSSPADLGVLAERADRLVITHQDLISYHNPFYFSSFAAWDGYRELTRRALAAADRVLFFSAHVRDDALAEELIEPARSSVVHIGVDHQVALRDPQPSAPTGAARLPADGEAMLCIGTDYRHKNRVFALRVASELQRRHGWDGRLVLAGSHMLFGSSRPEEERLLGEDDRLRDAVVDLGAVSETEKECLLGRVRLVLYPSVYEGFGLVPFEAAAHGVPCLWAAGTALNEILPDTAAGIIPWDPEGAADHALALMRDDEASAGNLAAVRDAGAALRWDAAAHALIEVYRTTCAEPPTPAGAYERREGLMRGGLSEDAMRLVGPDGLLPGGLERPLLALAAHPRLAMPLFRAVEAGYRASRWWRRD